MPLRTFITVSLQNTAEHTGKCTENCFPMYQHRWILKQKHIPLTLEPNKNKLNKSLKVHSNYIREKQNLMKEIRKQN